MQSCCMTSENHIYHPSHENCELLLCFFVLFWALLAFFTYAFHCAQTSSTEILQNFLFYIPLKEKIILKPKTGSNNRSVIIYRQHFIFGWIILLKINSGSYAISSFLSNSLYSTTGTQPHLAQMCSLLFNAFLNYTSSADSLLLNKGAWMVTIATKCTTAVRLIPMYVHRDEWKDEWSVTDRSIMHLKNKCIKVGGSIAVGVLCMEGWFRLINTGNAFQEGSCFRWQL